MKYYFLFLCVALLLFSENSVAQSQSSDFLRSTGKIYVVVGVLAFILVGIFAFLIYLERRIKKMESELKL